MKYVYKKRAGLYIQLFVAPTGLEPVYPAWEAGILTARWKRHFYFPPYLSAEAGGFEPPVRLPARQFSKLVVSATHPNFLPLMRYLADSNRRWRFCRPLPSHSVKVPLSVCGCKGTTFFLICKSFIWLFSLLLWFFPKYPLIVFVQNSK